MTKDTHEYPTGIAHLLPPVHPGSILADELRARGLTANSLALALRVPANRISDIVRGQQSITADWGVHLTGVRDLPPRAAQRRSLQAGRMSTLSGRLGGNGLWALAHNKVLITNRTMRDSELQDPVEQHPSAT